MKYVQSIILSTTASQPTLVPEAPIYETTAFCWLPAKMPHFLATQLNLADLLTFKYTFYIHRSVIIYSYSVRLLFEHHLWHWHDHPTHQQHNVKSWHWCLRQRPGNLTLIERISLPVDAELEGLNGMRKIAGMVSNLRHTFIHIEFQGKASDEITVAQERHSVSAGIQCIDRIPETLNRSADLV